MNIDFVPFIRGVRVLRKPRLIFSRINGSNVPLNASTCVTKFTLELNGMLSVPPSFNPYVASVGQITQTLTKNDNTLTSLEFSLRY